MKNTNGLRSFNYGLVSGPNLSQLKFVIICISRYWPHSAMLKKRFILLISSFIFLFLTPLEKCFFFYILVAHHFSHWLKQSLASDWLQVCSSLNLEQLAHRDYMMMTSWLIWEYILSIYMWWKIRKTINPLLCS